MMRFRIALIALAAVLFAVAALAQQSVPVSQSALPWLKLGDLAATRERPLFAPNRRPPEGPAPEASEEEAAAPQAPPGPAFALKGIIIQQSETLVLLDDMTTSRSVVVRSGENYGRWRVVAESANSVNLADGAEQIHLELFRP
jgi:hypothetical protein